MSSWWSLLLGGGYNLINSLVLIQAPVDRCPFLKQKPVVFALIGPLVFRDERRGSPSICEKKNTATSAEVVIR